MPSPRNYEWPQWHVTCTCLNEDGRPYSVREGCSDCAYDRAFDHRELGHQPVIHPPHCSASTKQEHRMRAFQIGDRIGVTQGALQGYYGHVTDRVIDPRTFKPLPCFCVRLIGDSRGENNPRFLSGEWCLPTHYLEWVD